MSQPAVQASGCRFHSLVTVLAIAGLHLWAGCGVRCPHHELVSDRGCWQTDVYRLRPCPGSPSFRSCGILRSRHFDVTPANVSGVCRSALPSLLSLASMAMLSLPTTSATASSAAIPLVATCSPFPRRCALATALLLSTNTQRMHTQTPTLSLPNFI